MSQDGTDEAAAALEVVRRIGGQALVAKMVSTFLAAAPKSLDSAREGAGRGDGATVRAACHSLKSSSAQVGALRLSAACARAEQAAATLASDAAALTALVAGLDAELAAARPRLERELPPAR